MERIAPFLFLVLCCWRGVSRLSFRWLSFIGWSVSRPFVCGCGVPGGCSGGLVLFFRLVARGVLWAERIAPVIFSVVVYWVERIAPVRMWVWRNW